MSNADERRPEGDALRVSSEIEEGYAEIGRAVVEIATRQAKQSQSTSPAEGESPTVDVMVSIRLTLDKDPQGMRPQGVCCVCVRDEWGVIICRGSCC